MALPGSQPWDFFHGGHYAGRRADPECLDLLGRDVGGGGVQCFDIGGGNAQEVRLFHILIARVPAHREVGAVELHQETGIDDRLETATGTETVDLRRQRRQLKEGVVLLYRQLADGGS